MAVWQVNENQGCLSWRVGNRPWLAMFIGGCTKNAFTAMEEDENPLAWREALALGGEFIKPKGIPNAFSEDG
jgi:hypothetical protein